MEQVVFDEIKKMLKESLDEPYHPEDDETMPDVDENSRRKPVLTLRVLNKLKEMRNTKRTELAQDSVLVPYLYGPPETPEGEMGGGDLGLGF